MEERNSSNERSVASTPNRSRTNSTSSIVSNSEKSSNSVPPQVQGENFNLGQSLTSILNDPKGVLPKDWYLSSDFSVQPNPSVPNYQFQDFKPYLDGVSEIYQKFVEYRLLIEKNSSQPPATRESLENIVQSIPQVFFQENFEVTKSGTGDVSEYTFISACQTMDPNLSQQIQDKLSYFLDLIEGELVRQISTRSSAFFESLTTLQDLHDEVLNTCHKIEFLRKHLKHFDEDNVKKSLQVPVLQQRRKNYINLHKKLKLISTVKQAQPTIQILLANSDYTAALDLIASTQEVLTTELAGIQSFKYMNLQLKEMEALIEKMIQAEFLNTVPEIKIGNPHNSDRKEKLTILISGLIRVGKLQDVLQAYRDQLVKNMKTNIKELLNKSLDITVDDEKNSQLDEKMKVLGVDAYFGLLKKIFQKVMDELNVISCAQNILLEAFTSSLNHLSQSDSEHLTNQVTTELQDIKYAVCETAHVKCSVLFKTRTSSNNLFSNSDFVALFNTTQEFIQQSEEIAGKQCYGLRPTLHAQAKSFIDNLHSNKMYSLTESLTNENWTQAEVPSDFQLIAYSLCDETKQPQNDIAQTLELKGKQFCVVFTLLLVIKTIQDYIQVVDQLPLMNGETTQRLIEILQMFNSRTCQLVLGAGAMQVRNLKSITAKHLALAFQCLGVVLMLLPHLKQKLEKNIPLKKHQVVLNDFDRLVQDYLDHQKEIFQKFASIMRERTNFHCKNLLTGDTVVDAQPSNSTISLMKETETMYKVLSQILFEPDIKKIFEEIFLVIKTTWIEKMTSMKATSSGKKRLAIDVAFLANKIDSLCTLLDIKTNLDSLRNFAL